MGTGTGVSTQLQQTEAQFQSAVIDYARVNGWRIAHFHDSRRQVGDRLVGDADAKGFPDLVLARSGRVVFAELKTQTGRLKAEQRDWLIELNGREEFGLEDTWVQIGALMGNPIPSLLVCLWRPDCWEEIQAVLR